MNPDDEATDNGPQKAYPVRGESIAKPALQSTVWPSEKLAGMFGLSGRTILVTGAGRGIGITATGAILEAGADVVCVDLLPEPSKTDWETIRGVAEKRNAFLSYHPCDVTDAESVLALFENISTTARYPLRGIVTCAGVQQMIPVLEYPVDGFRKVMDVNVVGTFLTAQAAARTFIKKGVPGSMVMIASMSGSIANKGLTCTAYNTSKSAVHQLCRSMAAELGGSLACPIRVNTLSPGYIRTAMTDQLLAEKPELEKLWMEGSMMGRLAKPEEITAPIVFLLADGSNFVTGADLRVDGGHCAW